MTAMVICAVRTSLSLLDKQEMHRPVCNDDERSRNHGEANDIVPVRLRVEAEGTQDRSSGHFNVQPVLVVDQGEEGHLIDDEGLEAVVEDGQLEHVSVKIIYREIKMNLHSATTEPTWEWHRGSAGDRRTAS